MGVGPQDSVQQVANGNGDGADNFLHATDEEAALADLIRGQLAGHRRGF